MLSTLKIINCLFLCVIGSQMCVKVTKILRICLKKSFVNFDLEVDLQRIEFKAKSSFSESMMDEKK
jgi:hypothetical protein